MEYLKKKISKFPLSFDNEDFLNIGMRHNSLKNYNNEISYSKDKLHLINRLMLNGKITEALSLAEQEIKKDKNNSNLYNAIGAILYNSDQKVEAERNFQLALVHDNKNLLAFNNIGKIYIDNGDLISALKCYNQAYFLNSKDKTSFQNLNKFLLDYFPTKYNELWLKAFQMILSNKTIFEIEDRRSLYKLAISFLMINPLLKSILVHIDHANRINKNFINNLFNLSKIKLFHICLQNQINYNLEFEKFLTKLRKYLLINLKHLPISLEINKLIQSIALQNSLNEFIFFENQLETKLITNIENQIKKEMKSKSFSNFTNLLLLGCYRDLKRFKWIKDINFPFDYLKLKERFVTLPFIEYKYKKSVIIIDKVKNKVSQNVKKQYEENPYPKWIHFPSSTTKYKLDEYLKKKKIDYKYKNNLSDNKIEILFAGCGTGKEPISYSLILENCNITAIDLSQSSLAYALRKTKEYNLTNINFFQCDILNVKNLKTKFDVICCNGVLHHLEDPIEGWRQLRNSLKDRGLMKISLYSKLARNHLKPYQEKYAKSNILDFEKEIRIFRNDILNSDKDIIDNFTVSRDFFNLSELRDLIFHYQEHQFTIPKIKKALKQLGFLFIGFEDNKDLHDRFHSFFEKNESLLNLNNWHQLEKANPKTFIEMYQFWIQKY